MKEIGGYIEIEHYHGQMLHTAGIKLDSGRNCLAYLIKARRIKKIAIPSFMCDSVFQVCSQYDVEMRLYQVGYDFLPVNLTLNDGEYLYLMNYYSQLNSNKLRLYKERFERIIVDNAQHYFAEPVDGVDTLYTCRKFFGVPDGAILYTDAILDEELEQSESFKYMTHLAGRYERTGTEFFADSINNNKRFENQPIRKMSKLTENLLHSIDYEYVKTRRTENFTFLHDRLKKYNRLILNIPEGPFMYPLLVKESAELKRKLIDEKVYVPTLWPNVVSESSHESVDYNLSTNILPLPCDQRYDRDDMKYVVRIIQLFYEC